jgi:hypothetical protein
MKQAYTIFHPVMFQTEFIFKRGITYFLLFIEGICNFGFAI